MKKNNQNSDSIPRASSNPDAPAVNWFVNLSPNLSVFSSYARFSPHAQRWTLRSLSLLFFGLGLPFAFPHAAAATDRWLNDQSIAAGSAMLDRSMTCSMTYSMTNLVTRSTSMASTSMASTSMASTSMALLPTASMLVTSASHVISPTSIAEVNNEDPDLTGQPGTPERTQGSGTR